MEGLQTALGFFAVGQFAVKKKPNLIWPNLTETNIIFSYGKLFYGKKKLRTLANNCRKDSRFSTLNNLRIEGFQMRSYFSDLEYQD